MTKRSRRFIVVEGVDEAQPLIKEFLRFWVTGCYRMMKIAQSRHQSHGLMCALGSVLLSCRHPAKQRGN